MASSKDHYLKSLTSGYALMGLQILIAMAQVPIALHFLGNEQFGVWALAAQVAMWLQMLDFGLNGAMARHMIQYLNNTDRSLLASCVATGLRVFSIQGVIVIVATILVRNFGHTAFSLTQQNSEIFGNTILLLGLATGARFPTKIIHSWLYATQRLDICNRVTLVIALIEFGFFTLLVTTGWGVYSLAWSRLCASILQIVTYCWIGYRKSDFPHLYLRTPWNSAMFIQLASFGGGMFLLTLGNQLLNISQTALISKHLGIAQAAVWATAPKLAQVGFQIVSKIWDYRMPYLASFMDDMDTSKLIKEFILILRITIYLAGVGLGLVAAINPNFLEIWTHHRIQWDFSNDVLLSLSIFITLIVRCITDLVFQAKIAAWMPLLMLIEGLMFIALASWALPKYGISGMIAASLFSSFVFRLPYAWCRFVKHYHLNLSTKLSILTHICCGLALGFLAYLVPSLVLYVGRGSHTWGLLALQLIAFLMVLGPITLKLSKRLRRSHG